jgi:SAM-dependent methyltransferase
MNDRPDIALEQRARSAARLSSPSASRNQHVIARALAGILPEGARVLEVASGTGEHALACVTERGDISWTPSEPDADSRASVDAWAQDAGGRIAPCLDLEMTRPDWFEAAGPFEALVCANMIHIAPWQAAEGLFAGARVVLAPDGQLCLYGPFLEGEASAPSNLDFDANLKARDPRWGVRSLDDVDALAARNGFVRAQRQAMPANNLMLVYVRSGP